MDSNLRDHCRKKAFVAFGTMNIFENRARKIGVKRDVITYLGIVAPLLTGAFMLSFGTQYYKYIAPVAGFVLIVQLAFSGWSLVARWDEKNSYAIGAVQAQARLFNKWDGLASRPPSDLDKAVRDLEAEDERQEQSDLTQNIGVKEKRRAMRASLLHFGLQCKTCGIKPISLKPLKCDTCGNF